MFIILIKKEDMVDYSFIKPIKEIESEVVDIQVNEYLANFLQGE